jgi:replicative DNA helicase
VEGESNFVLVAPDQLVDVYEGPQNEENEQYVLGAILIRPQVLEDVTKIPYSPDDFYLRTHTQIYQATVDLSRRGNPWTWRRYE